MRSVNIICSHPLVEIRLKLVEGCIQLGSECDLVELGEHRLVKSLADAIALWLSHPGLRVIDVLDGQVESVLVVLSISTVFGPTVREHPQDGDVLFFESGQDAVIESIGGDERILSVIMLGECNSRVGVDDGLLVDASNPLKRTDLERVLRDEMSEIDWARPY